LKEERFIRIFQEVELESEWENARFQSCLGDHSPIKSPRVITVVPAKLCSFQVYRSGIPVFKLEIYDVLKVIVKWGRENRQKLIVAASSLPIYHRFYTNRNLKILIKRQ
jgi:hypothetical protein